MSTSSSLEQQYRPLAEQLMRRAETDEAFAQQVRLDPVKALVDAGVPADAAEELLFGGPADAAALKNIAQLEQQYRPLAEQLMRRAETDEAFAQQVRLDPVKALVDAGVPADAAEELLFGGPTDAATPP